MTKSGILETRSNLSQIVNKVMRGNEHVILRKNVAVAKIVPIEEAMLSRARALIERTKEVRGSLKRMTIKELHDWKKEGRI